MDDRVNTAALQAFGYWFKLRVSWRKAKLTATFGSELARRSTQRNNNSLFKRENGLFAPSSRRLEVGEQTDVAAAAVLEYRCVSSCKLEGQRSAQRSTLRVAADKKKFGNHGGGSPPRFRSSFFFFGLKKREPAC